MDSVLKRYAVEGSAYVIALPYRVENEGGILDGYAAVKDIIADPGRFFCHPDGIAMMGDGGGGMITSQIAARMADAEETGIAL